MYEQIELRKAVEAITGKNENGRPKAIVTLQHQIVHSIDDDGVPTITVEDQANTMFAVASVVVSNGKVTMLLDFDSFEDDDYVRFRGLLKEYERGDTTYGNHLLVMTLADEDTASIFISMIVDLICFDGADPTIKLLGDAEQARYYAITSNDDDDVEEIDDLEENC